MSVTVFDTALHRSTLRSDVASAHIDMIKRFAKLANVSSTAQAERFVFSVDKDHERWLEKHLRQRNLAGSQRPS